MVNLIINIITDAHPRFSDGVNNTCASSMLDFETREPNIQLRTKLRRKTSFYSPLTLLPLTKSRTWRYNVREVNPIRGDYNTWEVNTKFPLLLPKYCRIIWLDLGTDSRERKYNFIRQDVRETCKRVYKGFTSEEGETTAEWVKRIAL